MTNRFRPHALRELSLLVSLGVVLGVLDGCQHDPVDPDEPIPHRIELTPARATLRLGDTVRLKATVLSRRGLPLDARGVWATTDSLIVRTDTSGLAVAVAEGSAQVSFSAAGVTAVADIHIAHRELQWTAVSAGCGIRQERLYCWNWLSDGVSVPQAVLPDERFKHVQRGNGHACAVTTEGTIYCWGSNMYGQLGDGTATDRSEPVAVNSLERFDKVAVGVQHTCALTADGVGYCWGNNSFGQLGADNDGETCAGDSCHRLPVPVRGDHRFVSLDAGGFDRIGPLSQGVGATCGITAEGAGLCWGANTQGILGDGLALPSDGTFDYRATPMPIAGGHQFKTISVGGIHACGVTTSGAMYCWGSNGDWQLAADDLPHEPPTLCRAADVVWTCTSNPALIELDGRALESVAAGQHTCVRLWHGGVQCWGLNTLDEVSPATPTSANHVREPADVAGGRTFFQIAGRGTVTCGLATTGDAVCWGGSQTPQIVPIPFVTPVR